MMLFLLPKWTGVISTVLVSCGTLGTDVSFKSVLNNVFMNVDLPKPDSPLILNKDNKQVKFPFSLLYNLIDLMKDQKLLMNIFTYNHNIQLKGLSFGFQMILSWKLVHTQRSGQRKSSSRCMLISSQVRK